jgi:transcriptional regulator with GAF, ATPase, and Fis domain
MPQLYHDVLFCTTFLIVLISIIKITNGRLQADRNAFNRIIMGLGLLTGFAVVQLFGHQGAFDRLPYLQEESGRKILEATVIAAGLMFLLVGIGGLLPSLARGRRMRRQTTKRYFGLKMILPAVSGGKTLDETFDVVMNHLATYLEIPRWAGFKYASKQDLLVLTGSVGFPEKHPRHLRTVSIKETELKAELFRFQAMARPGESAGTGETPGPRLVVPVAYGGRLYGALFSWGDVAVDDDLLDVLTLLGEILGRQAQMLVLKTNADFYRNRQVVSARVADFCNRASAIGDILVELFQVLRDVTAAEFCSIAVVDNSGENMVRYTIGSGGRMLLEKGVSRSTGCGTIHRIIHDGQPLIEADVDFEGNHDPDDGLFLSCGMHARLACPVSVGRRIPAVIMLGHSQSNHFKPVHLDRVRDIAAPMAGVVQREQLSRTLEIREDQMLRLQMMERELATTDSAQAVFDEACQLLTKRMKSTVARISLIDRDGRNLFSQACRTIRDTGHDLKENATLPISLLPWHKMTIETRKPMLINREDPQSQMPAQETMATLLPDVRSAILVPIMLDDIVRGVISIGEARNWNRRPFGASDLIFARDVAAKCSVALRMKKLELDGIRGKESVRQNNGSGAARLSELTARIKSPVTSIMGAVELLKIKGDAPGDRSRYQGLILKAADRITALTEEYATSPEPIEEQETEPVVG